MSSKAVGWVLLSVLWISACSDDKHVVIQPGAFSEDWPTALRAELIDNNKCAIDQINGKDPHQHTLAFKRGETLSMSGWTFSKTDGAPPAVYVQLVGPALTYTALAQKRTARPDVNLYFKVNAAWNTGFELSAVQSAEPGEYQLEVLQPGRHGVAQCESSVYIKIDPPTPGT